MDMLIADRRQLLLMPLLASVLGTRSAQAAPDPSMTVIKPPHELTWVKAEGFPEKNVEQAPLWGRTSENGQARDDGGEALDADTAGESTHIAGIAANDAHAREPLLPMTREVGLALDDDEALGVTAGGNEAARQAAGATAQLKHRASSRAIARATLPPLGRTAPMPSGLLSQWRKKISRSPRPVAGRLVDAGASSGVGRSASRIGRAVGDDDVDEPVGGARLLHLCEGGTEDRAHLRVGHGDAQWAAVRDGAQRRRSEAVDGEYGERRRIERRGWRGGGKSAGPMAVPAPASGKAVARSRDPQQPIPTLLHLDAEAIRCRVLHRAPRGVVALARFPSTVR